jgi:hypothetical protein
MRLVPGIRGAEQALGADSPVSSLYSQLCGRAAQAQRYIASSRFTLRFRILRNTSSETLLGLLPQAYQGRLPPRTKDYNFGTVIVFHLDRGVVSSSAVEKAIAKLREEESDVLAIGHDFTLEAQGLLRSRGVETVSLREYIAWTDESYERIRVFIGAKVKRP